MDFRTIANGGYKWMRAGLRRGYWRVLEVRDCEGPRNKASHNVIRVLYASRDGIDGVTKHNYGISVDRMFVRSFPFRGVQP